jgi:Fe2+ or Zn2+ uptake regulation protein
MATSSQAWNPDSGASDGGSSRHAEQVLEALHGAGYRMTKTRRVLVQRVASSRRLQSAAELVEAGSALGVSRPTVFRLLDT